MTRQARNDSGPAADDLVARLAAEIRWCSASVDPDEHARAVARLIRDAEQREER